MIENVTAFILNIVSLVFLLIGVFFHQVAYRARKRQDAATERIIESQEKIIKSQETVIKAERDRNSHLWYALAISSGDPQIMRMVRKAYGPHGVLDEFMESQGISLEETPQG